MLILGKVGGRAWPAVGRRSEPRSLVSNAHARASAAVAVSMLGVAVASHVRLGRAGGGRHEDAGVDV